MAKTAILQQQLDEAPALALLRDRKFFYHLCQRIGAAGVTGELCNRLVVYLACLTSIFKTPVSVLVKGCTSSGKNNLAKAVLALIPEERRLNRTSFSDKAIANGSIDLTGKILYIVEHRAGRDSQLYNRLLQSEGALDHEVTTGRGKTKLISRQGAPGFLSTTTDDHVYADDETRYLSIRSDESAALTKEILKAQFRVQQSEPKPTDLSKWHEIFLTLTAKVQAFAYPKWFSYLADKIPADNSRARRDVPRFLSLFEAVALCLSFSDGRYGKSQIEITFPDYCVAYQILNEAFSSTYAGAHPMAMKFADAVRELYSTTNKPVPTSDVKAHLGWESIGVVHKWKAFAVREKLVRFDDGTYPMNQKPLLPGSARKATAFLPEPQLVLDEWPELADEARFINPISGNEEVIRRTIKKSSIKETE